MYPFAHTVSPALQNHQHAQLAFFNDISKSFFRTVQRYSELNLQLAQTLLEEMSLVGAKLVHAHQPNDVAASVAARSQPASDKLRAYQQHLAQIAADSQIDIAKVTEAHVSETSRTARELADQVSQAAAEETAKAVSQQQEAMRNFADPFEQFAKSAGRHQGNEMRGSSTMQSAGQDGAGSRDDLHAGNAQGYQSGSAQGVQQGKPGASQTMQGQQAKPGGAARKET